MFHYEKCKAAFTLVVNMINETRFPKHVCNLTISVLADLDPRSNSASENRSQYMARYQCQNYLCPNIMKSILKLKCLS